jgi:hypothetical protein
VPNPLRRKVYRVRTAGGTDWFVLARKGQPGWEKTDISPKEYQEQLVATEEILNMLESDDIDDRRLMELHEKASGKKIYCRDDSV